MSGGGERVCVLFGGSSDEREISLKSGNAILEALKRKGVHAVGLDAQTGFEKELTLEKPHFVFIAIHGKGGEDGAIQKKLQAKRIPFVGSDSKASLIAFDKAKAKRIFEKNKIPTPAWVLLRKKENWQKSILSIPLPVVVKPLCNGSSIDIMMAETRAQLKSSLRRSFLKYDSIMVEQKIKGREFTVGILGKQALPVIELKPKRSFYDFKAKYTKGLTDYLIPAPIPSQVAKKIQKIAIKTHQALRLRDFSRVDFMMDRSGRPYVLEANSIPGFTETSLLPKAAQAIGIDFDELCFTLLNFARKRAGKK